MTRQETTDTVPWPTDNDAPSMDTDVTCVARMPPDLVGVNMLGLLWRYVELCGDLE